MVIAQTSTPLPKSARLSRLRQLTNSIVDLFFPPHCVGCHRLGSWLCERCIDQIETIHSPICLRCGRPVDSQVGAIASDESHRPRCGHCGEMPTELDALRSFAYFGGLLREAIHQLKYDGVTVLAGPLGQLMALAWPDLAPEGQEQVDAIVPVPLHPKRERERGYNQASLLAHALGNHLNRPVVEDVLRRSRATAPQVGLGTQERRANVHDAFRCTGGRLTGRCILLVDDVCTTGATLEAAASALRAGGASAVIAYTLARAR
jgi:ComF family protein